LGKVDDQIKFASFKQVPGGYVFRAPNPKVFGRSDHYLVDEAQRDKIVNVCASPSHYRPCRPDGRDVVCGNPRTAPRCQP
jgi:hypothetical protein